MLTLNDSNASHISGGQAIFAELIEAQEDILIQSTCIFLAGIRTPGKITAQYDLVSMGDLTANSISVNGKLICLKDVESQRLEVVGQLVVNGKIKSESFTVTDQAHVGELYCNTLASMSSVFVQRGMDVQKEANVEKYIVCMDGLQADGVVATNVLVANKYADIADEIIDKKIIISKYIPESMDKPITSPGHQSIAAADLEDIFDYQSPLAMALEEISSFIEHFKELFSDAHHPMTSEKEVALIKAYASYFSEFEHLYNSLERVRALTANKRMHNDDWYEMFVGLVNFILNMPDWLVGSQIAQALYLELNTRLQQFAANQYKTKSISQWSSCLLGLLNLQVTVSPVNQRLVKQVTTMLFEGIGIKERTVQLYFPSA